MQKRWGCGKVMEVEEKREPEGGPEGRGPGGCFGLAWSSQDAVLTVAAGLTVLGYSQLPPATERLSHQAPNLYRVVIIALLERRSLCHSDGLSDFDTGCVSEIHFGNLCLSAWPVVAVLLKASGEIPSACRWRYKPMCADC